MFVRKQPVKKNPLTMINDCVCQPSVPLPIYPFPSSPSLSPPHLQAPANIYLAVYPGSMQSWMSATQEFFCSESMVSRMYSPPFSTCGSSHTRRSRTERIQNKAGSLIPQQNRGRSVNTVGCLSYLQNKSVVPVRHLQWHGGPHLHNG